MVEQSGDGQRFLERLCGGNYGVVPSHVLLDPDLTANEKALFAILCVFAMDRDDCWPASDLLCAALGWSDKTLQRTRQSLRRKGRIDLKAGLNNNWIYRLNRSGEGLPRTKAGLRRIETLRRTLGLPEVERRQRTDGKGSDDCAWVGTSFRLSRANFDFLMSLDLDRDLEDLLAEIDDGLAAHGRQVSARDVIGMIRRGYEL